MKNLLVTTVVVTAFVCGGYFQADAQWAQTNGPYGGSINCFAVSGTNLFAGGGGVFFSTNNGIRWTATSLTNTPVYALAVSDTNLFAGTSGGVFRSTDNGTSWAAVNAGLRAHTGITCFAGSDTNLFAGNWGFGVYRSANNGTSWTPTGLGYADVSALAVSPNGAGGTNLFAGTPYGVFLSTNNGTSWTAVNTGLTKTLVQVLAPDLSGNLFAGTCGGAGVYRSTDNGSNWTPVGTGLTDRNITALAVSPDGSGNLFAGNDSGGIFLSTNNGTSWTVVGLGSTHYSVQALAVSGTNLFAGTEGGGVYRSTDNGTNWTNVDFTATVVTSFAIFPNGRGGSNLFAGASSSGGVFLSTNNGANWVAANVGLPLNPEIRAFAVSPSTGGMGGTNLFVGTYGSDGVYLSTNNGASWTAANTGLTCTGVFALAVSGTNLFAGTVNGGVFLSTDNGASWTAVNAGLTNTWVYALAVSPPDSSGSGNLFAGTNGGVFLSTDSGTSWTQVNSGLTNLEVRALAVSGSNLFAGTVSGVFLSTNNGASWVNTGASYTWVRALTFSDTNLFAVANGGVILSTNNGTSWTAVNSGLTDTDVLALAVSGPNIFAGTHYGVCRRPLWEMIHYVLLHLTALPGNGEVLLRWSKDNHTNFMRYRIYGGTFPSPTTPIDSTTGGATDTTIIIHGLANGTTYYFRVTPMDSAGIESGYSNEVAAIPDVFIFSMNIGWNMAAVPLTVSDYRKSVLFPFAVSPAYAFEGGYVVKDTLVNGHGYWLKLNGSQYVSMDGSVRGRDTIKIREGWNMIGTISTPVAVVQITSDPGGLVTSQFYGYMHGYSVSDTLQPTRGYWVKMNQEGKLILSSSTSALKASNRIRIVPTDEQPPAAPGEKEVVDVIPKTYALYQNYPNPFNPTTDFEFRILDCGFVSLKIYDVLGREVATLVNEVKQPGKYTVTWDASSAAGGIPSSVYFYRLRAGTFTETRKLLLLR